MWIVNKAGKIEGSNINKGNTACNLEEEQCWVE